MLDRKIINLFDTIHKGTVNIEFEIYINNNFVFRTCSNETSMEKLKNEVKKLYGMELKYNKAELHCTALFPV